MHGPILTPLDGSSFGEQALPTALALARRTGAPLELVHVHEPPPSFGNAPMYDTRLDAEQRRAMHAPHAHLAERLAHDHGLTVRAVFLDGPVVATLQQYAEESEARLIVMTTHGRGGVSRAWFGSVADGLVRGVMIPVLLVRPAGEARPDEPLFHRVLVPLDGSAVAEEVLEQLAVLGEPGTTEYTLLACVDALASRDAFFGVGLDAGGLGGGGGWATALPELVTAREADLARVAERMRRAGARVRTDVVMHEQAARAILDYAAEHPVDLIALTTHGRGALGRLFMGGTADKVMRGAPVPVLLYRPQGSEVEDAVPPDRGAATQGLTAVVPPSF